MTVTRRSFVGGMLAAGGAAAFPCCVFADAARPNLRFGVLSDVHIGGKPDAAARVERALRWFASKDVDAVLCPGDIAHSGHIGELEAFAEAWHRVFPGNGERVTGNVSPERSEPRKRSLEGWERVKLMISTGNHDVDAWGGRWKNFTEEKMLAERFNYKDNPEKTWQRLFNQKWELIWRCEVKGYTFIGSQWSSLKPPIEDYFKTHAAELRGAKPFFYCQHEHPKGTCHGKYSMGDDRGESVRALSSFPNAVAFTGHSHCAISDERTVWQGAFTSIGAGCLHEGAGGFNYDNVTAYWHPSYRKKFMCSMADPKSYGGDAKGGGCELVEVFDDYLVVHRQSLDFGRPIGPAWTVPIPARKNGPFDFDLRSAHRTAPQFASDAKVSANFCPNGHGLEGVAHKGEPCIYVSFPRAKTVDGCRVFDYLVEATAEGMDSPAVRKLIAAGFAYPEENADIPGECLFSAAELPTGKPIRFVVTPRDCFGLAGRPLVSTSVISM